MRRTPWWFGPQVIRVVGICTITLLALAFSPVTPAAYAQTGAPPPQEEAVVPIPPGTTVIDALYPAVPPAGIPPVPPGGIIAIIPATANAVAVINVPFSDTIASFIIPAHDEIDQVVRLEPFDANRPPPTAVPMGVDHVYGVFVLDIYNLDTAEQINFHEKPIWLGLDMLTHKAAVTLLLHYNDDTQKYTVVPMTHNPVTGDTIFEITETSPFALGEGNLAAAAPPTILPLQLPNTGTAPTVNRSLLSLLILAGGISALGVARWYYQTQR